jgi:hypothetical protein
LVPPMSPESTWSVLFVMPIFSMNTRFYRRDAKNAEKFPNDNN